MSVRERVRELAARCRVESGEGFSLSERRTDEKNGVELDKRSAAEWLEAGVNRLAELQPRLYADDRWSVLCIFQAMDAGGKDGAIKHVFSGLNPQGCQVTAFSAPGGPERDQDFLRRHVEALPQRGRIGIHNRSWYEEVLVPRVQPAVLEAQKLPFSLVGPAIWDERLADIAAFERYLSRQGTVVLKFFLHLGAEEQRERFLARIDDPEKNWKLLPSDISDRALWDDYQHAYECAIRATAAPHAPWFVIPADRKWLARLLVAEVLVEALESLDLQYPVVSEERREELRRAGEALRR